MNSVREYHNAAIRAAQLAMTALHQGDQKSYRQQIEQALLLEKNAADLVPDDKSSKPTRAMLYRSAASFAYQAEEYEEAERLIFKGLAGYPPYSVKQQLLEVQQMISEALSQQQNAENSDKQPRKQIVTAIYENGALHPVVALPLKEHQKVDIQILPISEGMIV